MTDTNGGRLVGKVAIITGAGRGIGYAYAERFLQEGAKVVVAELNEELGAEAAERLCNIGEAVSVVTDIADQASTERCVAATLERFGSLDIVLNNAGLYGDWDATDQSLGYLRQMFDINLHGAWLMARAASPSMVEQRFGRIINVASIGAFQFAKQAPDEFTGLPSFNYPQSKWGVVGLTKHMAGYLGKWGITVNCIAPGLTFSDSTLKLMSSERLEAAGREQAIAGRIEPSEMAGAAVFFASDDARFISGQQLIVDGGRVIV